MINDELKVYRGKDYIVSKYIVIHQPELGEIEEYGEQKYFNMIYNLTATPQSMKWQLWDYGIDYTKISPFMLFCTFLYQLYPQTQTEILFGNLDLSKFEIHEKEDHSLCLRQIVNDELVIIDEFTYTVITDYLRQAHSITKDEKLPGNEKTKLILIEDARDEYLRNRNKEYRSQLKNLVSTMVNCEGFKYNHSQVWDMKINAFMDSVRRISKIKNADLLLQSGYSGFGVNLKDISKKQLDWLGELD